MIAGSRWYSPGRREGDREPLGDVSPRRARTWATYSDAKKRQAARLVVRNNPRDCRGVDPERIPHYVDKAYGTDYPLATLASKVMLGHCELVQMGE